MFGSSFSCTLITVLFAIAGGGVGTRLVVGADAPGEPKFVPSAGVLQLLKTEALQSLCEQLTLTALR